MFSYYRHWSKVTGNQTNRLTFEKYNFALNASRMYANDITCLLSCRLPVFMWRKYYLGIVLNSALLLDALEKCREPIRSTHGDYLSGHVISKKTSTSLSECVIMCSYEFSCKSMNFLSHHKTCDLNDAERHTHPEDYGLRIHGHH